MKISFCVVQKRKRSKMKENGIKILKMYNFKVYSVENFFRKKIAVTKYFFCSKIAKTRQIEHK